MLAEIVAELLHAMLVGCRKIHIGNLMEADKVHTQLGVPLAADGFVQRLQQIDDGLGMLA